ncbi:MAG: ABC transporter ATP-binding protein [Candidatus Brocadiia bacterium]
MTGQVILKADRISMTYNHGASVIRVLDEISLELKKGEFTTIMGPSGSGKSTLLHILSGLQSPSGGNVLISGNCITSMPDSTLTEFRRRHIGLVFQDFNLIPMLSAEENIMLPLILDGKRPAAGEVDHILKLLEIEHRRCHRPGELSGGECQRVAIGRALVTNPAIIFADEPTGNLDSRSSNNFCELLRRLNETEGRTILMVTHSPAVAAWSNRILFLKDGKIRGELNSPTGASTDEIVERLYGLLLKPGVRV